jgi:hypothetical protein
LADFHSSSQRVSLIVPFISRLYRSLVGAGPLEICRGSSAAPWHIERASETHTNLRVAEHYKEGFEPLVKWKRFRTDFIGFIDAVDIEKQLFDQMLERFLISADVPHEEIQLFMTKPDYEGWRREDLVGALHARLGPSYEVYMSTIKTMNGLMHDLQVLLSLKNGEVGAPGHPVAAEAEANTSVLRSNGQTKVPASGTTNSNEYD